MDHTKWTYIKLVYAKLDDIIALFCPAMKYFKSKQSRLSHIISGTCCILMLTPSNQNFAVSAPERFGNWAVGCAVEDDTTPLPCRVYTRLITASDKELIQTAVLLPRLADQGKSRIRTPLGTALKAGIVVKIGSEGRNIPIFFLTCLENGCYAELASTASTLRQFSTADQIEVRFIYDKPITIPLKTIGLNDALSYIKMLNANP